MTSRELHRLLIAPELIVVDATLAVLAALQRALRVEHPLLDAQPDDDDPVRRRARVALAHAAQLRRALRGYRSLVRHIARLEQRDDLPF